jgi:L1 cell adhesion molecule like protein
MKTSLGSDFTVVETTITDALKWLESSDDKTTEDFESKQKEVEGTVSPLIAKAYQSSVPQTSVPQTSVPQTAEGGMPDMSAFGADFANSFKNGPVPDEVD